METVDGNGGCIPGITGAILTIAWAATTAATSTAGVTAAVSIAVSLASTLISKALQGTPAQAGRTVTTRDAAAARRVVYGQCLVGGVPTFLHLSSAPDHPNQYLTSIYTLCGHEINALVSVLFDGTPIVWGGYNTNPRMPLFYQENGIYHGQVWYDFKLGKPCEPSFPGMIAITARDGSNLWTAAHRQDGCASVALVLSWNSNVFPNGPPATSFLLQGKKLFDPRTNTTYYTSNAALAIYDFLRSKEYGLGADPSEINTASVIAAANTCDENVGLKAGGTENRYEVHGMFTVDSTPTDILNQLAQAMAGSVIFSQGQWYLIPGVWTTPSVTLDDDDMRGPIQLQTLRPKRELCNAVSGTIFAAGLTGTSRYQKVNFPPVVHPIPLCQDSGYPNAFLRGQWATATAYAVGDCVIDEASRSITGVWIPSHAYVVNNYVRDSTTGGVYVCTANHTSSIAGVTGNEPGLGSTWTSDWADVSATYSEFRGGVYVCTTAHTSDPLSEPGIGANSLNDWIEMKEYIWKDIGLNFTTSAPMAQRIANITLERMRHQTTAILKCKLGAFQLQPGDTFFFNHPRFGWNPATFQVMQSDFVIDDQSGETVLGIDIKVQMVDASIYAWDPASQEQALGQPAQPTIPDTEYPRPTPVAYGPGFTWTSTTTSVRITWNYAGGNAIVLLDQENTSYTPAGTQNITGLATNTAYSFFPYYNVVKSVFSGLLLDGIGTPAWLQSSTDPAVLRADFADVSRYGNIALSLSAVAVSTTASGTGGGGGGGGGGCLRAGMFVKERSQGVMECQLVKVGDFLWSQGDKWLEVYKVDRQPHDLWCLIKFTNGCELTVTIAHPFTLALVESDAMKRAAQLCMEDALFTPTGVTFPQSISFVREDSEKIPITIEGPHTFYASADGVNWVLTHNIMST